MIKIREELIINIIQQTMEHCEKLSEQHKLSREEIHYMFDMFKNSFEYCLNFVKKHHLN